MVAVDQVEGSRRSLRHLPVAWTRFEVGSGGGAGSVSLALAERVCRSAATGRMRGARVWARN